MIITNALGGCPVTGIGEWAFNGCTGLTSVTIPDSVTSIGEGAFSCCIGLTSVTIPADVTSIGGWAFDYCTGLTNFTVDTGNMFYCSVDGVLFDRNQAVLITFPAGRTGSYAIPVGVTSIGNFAFGYCTGLTSVTIPAGVTSIGEDAFSGCTGLIFVTIPVGCASIGSYAFSHCDGLTSVTIPAGVTTIGGRAFEACTGLTSVTISAGVTSIGLQAFRYCTSLTSVTIPDSVTSIGTYAFSGCESLTNLTVDAGNMFYCSVDGVLFDRNQTALIHFPGGRAGSYAIPVGVTSIGFNVFSDCTGLTSVFFKGDAPALDGDSYTFIGSPVTVYYLTGTTGWTSTFCGRPTLLWNPQVLFDDQFGVHGDHFGFNISGTINIPVVVEATTNLSSGVWTPLLTNTLGTAGTLLFNDPESTHHPARFYRIVWP